MMKNLYLTIAILFLSTNAMASWYVGGGIGQTDYDADEVSSFENPTAIELIIGNDINSNFSFEASYIDFGDADDGIAPNWRLSAEGVTLGALLKAPVNRDFDIFFKVGLNKWDAEIREDGFGVFFEDDGTDIFYGIGAAIKVSDKVNLGARYNVYDFDNEDVTMFSLNLLVGF